MRKFFVFFFLLAISISLPAQDNNQESIDQILHPFSENTPGYALVVINDGQIEHRFSKGRIHLDEKKAFETTTVFNIGALTKQFVAVSVLRLVDKNKMKLEDQLGTIIENIPDYAANITIRDLLKHKSYLPDYELNDDLQTNSDIIDFLNTKEGLRNDADGYSNLDYPLLVYIVEQVSSKSFRAYLDKTIFRKLDMDDSYVYGNENLELSKLPALYKVEDSSFVQVESTITQQLLGEQGVYSSLEDYAKFEKAFYTDKIVDCELLYEIFPKDISGTELGYGWVCMQRNGFRYFWHGSGTHGLPATLIHYPDYSMSLLFVTNNQNLGLPLKMIFEIAQVFEPAIYLR